MLNTQEESAKVAIKTKEARSKNYEFVLVTEPFCSLFISKEDLSIALPLDVRDLNALADLLMEAVSQKIGIKA